MHLETNLVSGYSSVHPVIIRLFSLKLPEKKT